MLPKKNKMKRVLQLFMISVFLMGSNSSVNSQYLISCEYVNTTNPLGLSLAT